ncbi:MAG: lycopene cyclase domain-containing protein [Myxococcaceae bacterium]
MQRTSLLKPLIGISVLMLVMVGARAVASAVGLAAPWYLLHELTVMLVPMLWLLVRVLPRLDESQRIGFVVTSGLFISASAIAELLAIQSRYWAFYEGNDPLSGLDLGAIPLEEFLSYPLLLNVPVLWFLELSTSRPDEAVLGEGRASGVVRFCKRAALVALGAAGVLIGLALTSSGTLDVTTPAFVDAAGAVRYAAGPKQYGWTIVQALGWAGTFWLGAAVAHRVRWRTLLIVVVTYFPFALFVELLACGRGWWVWNSQQTLGVFAWVLPIESFSMYLTGALMPVLCFEWLKGLWANAPSLSPTPVESR